MSKMVVTEGFNAPLHPDEAEVSSNIRITLETLQELGIDPRKYRPVLKSSRTGQVVDGLHRLMADPDWPIMEGDFNQFEEAYLRLVFNFNRRQIPPEEMTKSLDTIAQETGWTPIEVAQRTGIPYRTVMKYLSNKYKQRKHVKDEDASAAPLMHGGNKENHSALSEEPTEKPEVTPRHEFPDVRVPDWLQRRFEELNKEAATLEHEGLSTEEEEPEPMTPEETLSEIYSELPVPPPTRFLETSLRRDHPDLTEEQIDEVIERTRPPEPDRLKSIYGYACPVCQTWKPPSSMKRLVRELEKKDPKLAALVKERLTQQGWTA